MKRFAVSGICASLICSSVQAQELKGCATEAEAHALLIGLAPVAFRGIQQSCAAILPSNSFIAHPPAAFSKELESSAAAAWPNVPEAVDHLIKGQGVPLDPAFRSLTQAQFEGFVTPITKGMVKPEDCASADRMLELARPLPLSNLVDIFLEILKIAERPKMAKGLPLDLPICAAGVVSKNSQSDHM